MARAEGVSRVLAFRDSGDFESSGKLRWQVFQGVHREIDAAGGECLFDFFGEHSLGADLGKSDVGDFVTGGMDDLNLDLVTAATEKRGDVVGLPEGELGAAGADAQTRHQCCVPTSLLGASFAGPPESFSRRLNRRRTTSTTVVASASFAAVFRVVIGVCITLLIMPRVRASTAISCSGVSWPMRPRTRSISAWRMVSR